MTMTSYRDAHAKELREVLKLWVVAVKAAGRLVVAEVLTPTPVFAPESTSTMSPYVSSASGTGENAAYPAPVQGGI